MDVAQRARHLLAETQQTFEEIIRKLQDAERELTAEQLRFRTLSEELVTRQERARTAAANGRKGASVRSPELQERLVHFNVSGTPFVAERDAMVVVPDSVLAALVSGAFPVDVNHDGAIVLDRDPGSFRTVMRYLELRREYDDPQTAPERRDATPFAARVQKLLSRLCPSELAQLPRSPGRKMRNSG
jgi:hypothetical protein